MSAYDVAVVGAGFGGLAAALRLGTLGARVVVLEALRYPGGCASTFTRSGRAFESGATLFAGLAPGQLFSRWAQEHEMDVEFELLDPAIELRGPFEPLPISADKARFVDELLRREPEHALGLRAFFREQGKVADLLWGIFDDPHLLPPFGPGALLRHLGQSPRYAALASRLGRPLNGLLRKHGLDRAPLFSAWADATSQITLQCAAAEAEAPFALASLDYPFRGVGHVRGGIGTLAVALCQAIERQGGEVRFARRVKNVERTSTGYRLDVTKDPPVHAEAVVANVLPQALQGLVSFAAGGLQKKAERVAAGWGAAMLYRAARAPEGAPKRAFHLELIDNPDAPFTEGNHVFVSVQAAGEGQNPTPGVRSLTISTHVRLDELRGASDAERAERIGLIQARMRQTLAKRAPEWEDVELELPASPRTFERFTGRPEGLVGGIPRTAGLHHYAGALPRPVARNLYLVGDSVFPGQSTLAVALSGIKVAEAIAHRAPSF